MRKGTAGVLALVWVAFAGPAGADDAEKCEAAKLKIAGKYNFCRLNAEAKAVKTGDPVDHTKCDSSYALKWEAAETKGSGMCPTSGDQADVQNQITADAHFIALKLKGVRFVDNGDGTVTDVETGLMWEQKDDNGGIHDQDNFYRWSATATAPDGPAFTTFLATLNNGTSQDGHTIDGCFAGYCDWRLPTIAELRGLIVEGASCGAHPCLDPAFGRSPPFLYWSATAVETDPNFAFVLNFSLGVVRIDEKAIWQFYVRAVRGGS